MVVNMPKLWSKHNKLILSFKPPSIKATESKQPNQDLTSLNTKTLSLYSKNCEALYGYFRKIKDVKITAEKKISRLKWRSENWPKFAWSNWTLRYKTVKTRKHYRKYLLFLNFGIWPHFTAILTTVSTRLKTTKIDHW